MEFREERRGLPLMKASTVLVGIFAAVINTACTSPPPARGVVERFERVRLERSTCYGTCPAYAVTLESNGQVTFEGIRFVRAMSGQSVIGPGRIRAVREALDVAQFRTMREQYATTADGCEDVATDLPTVTLSVTIDGRTKTVRHYLGCLELPTPAKAAARSGHTPDSPPEWRPPDPPPPLPCSGPRELVTLESQIDALLGSERWSGTVGGWMLCGNEAGR